MLTEVRFACEFSRIFFFHSSIIPNSLHELTLFYCYVNNDTYLQGDSILKEVAEIMREHIRKIDFPARYGGEEFIIIAPNTKIEEMLEVAERIRKFTEVHEFKGGLSPLKITLSVGVAAMQGNLENGLELIKMADDALYLARDSGRNLVCVANELE